MGFFGCPGAHFRQQESAAWWEERDVLEGEFLAAHEIQQQGVESFEADGAVFQNPRHSVGGEKGVVEGQRRKHAKRGAGRKVEGSGDDRGARPLGTNQRACNVKAVLRQQFVEVVTGDPAWNARKPGAHQICIPLAQAGEARIDLPRASTAAHGCVELGRVHAPDGHAGAVVENYVERLNIVHHLAA